jgi:hypothetical protein
MPQMPRVSASGRKAMENFTGLGRTAMQSHFRAALDNPPPGVTRPPLQNFDTGDIWPWITNWIKATFQTDIEGLFVPADKKHSLPTYPATGERGHYDLTGMLAPDGSIRIALAGDWATGTDVSQQIADSMVSTSPELTIHLGDIYYVGQESEVRQNCLGEDTPTYKGVFWRKGTKGSFALNGNHEMYSGGNAYFDDFLNTLGIPGSADQKQLSSYFCLETPVWRVLAIDTGYNADTLSGDCKLEQSLLDWVHQVIDPVHNRKPTALLSHHQWFSGFGDGDYGKPADQIAPFLEDQEIVWLWGHEHRLAVYYKYKSPDNRLTAYARCIGHGGMPIEMPDAQYPNGERDQKVEYWDGLTDLFPARFQKLGDGTLAATNGYAQMVIQGPVLTLEYLDADRTSVLKESFAPGGGAKWDGTLVRTVVNDPQILNKIIYE